MNSSCFTPKFEFPSSYFSWICFGITLSNWWRNLLEFLNVCYYKSFFLTELWYNSTFGRQTTLNLYFDAIFFTRLYLLTLNFVNILAWSFFLSKGIFVICIVCFCSINLWTLARSCIQIHLNTHLNRIVHCQLAKVVVTLYLRLRNEFQPCHAKNQASNWLTCWTISISGKRRQKL